MEERVYMCAICGKSYDSIAQRINCEQTCLKKQEEEKKKAAEAKKAAEYADRKAEVDAAFDHAYKLRNQLIKDYGSYTYNKVVNNVRDFYVPFSWLWE